MIESQAEEIGTSVNRVYLEPTQGYLPQIFAPEERQTPLHAVVTAYLENENLGNRCFRTVHSFRRDSGYTVAFSSGNRRTTSLLEPAQEHAESLDAHLDLLKTALPGYKPCSRPASSLHGTLVFLDAPAVDPSGMLKKQAPPAYLREVNTGAPEVILPNSLAPEHRLNSTLAVLASYGQDIDLVLEFTTISLGKQELEALEALLEKLIAAQYEIHESEYRAEPIAAAANMVRAWLDWKSGIRARAWLQYEGVENAQLSKAVEALLFESENLPPKLRAKPAGTCNLAGCMLNAGQLPQIVLDPAEARNVARTARLRALAARRGSSSLHIGRDEAGMPVSVSSGALAQHLYVIGATGTGKTTLFTSLIRQDIDAGRGVFVIDPHGDMYSALHASLPARHRERLVVADAGDFDNPFTLNILETGKTHRAIQRNFVIGQLLALVKGIYRGTPEAFGPVFELYFRNALMLLMEAQGDRAVLMDLDKLFHDEWYRDVLLERCENEEVVRFWKEIATRITGDHSLINMASYITSKVTRIVNNPLLKQIVCSPESSLDIPAALREGRVVLVNLAKGKVGGLDSAFLGGIITIRLFSDAMARADIPPENRKTMRVYLDEFQTHATGVLGEMMAEARKFGLSLVLANQSIEQVQKRGADIAHAILSNSANLLSFRIGPGDAQTISRWLGGDVPEAALVQMPNYHCMARLIGDSGLEPLRLVGVEPYSRAA